MNRESELLQAEINVRDSYGVMPEEKWLELRSEAAKQALRKPEATLAEYFNSGCFEKNPDGVGYIFSIEYNGKCDVCGFEFVFEHEEKVSTSTEEPAVQTSTDQHKSESD